MVNRIMDGKKQSEKRIIDEGKGRGEEKGRTKVEVGGGRGEARQPTVKGMCTQ